MHKIGSGASIGDSALEEHVQEDLRVELVRRRVERRARDRGLDLVLRGDRVRGEQGDELSGAEACVAHAREDVGHRVKRVGDLVRVSSEVWTL